MNFISFSKPHHESERALVLLYLSQHMRLWYLSHRRPAKAQTSLRIRAVSSEPSLFTHMKYGSRQRVRQKTRHLSPLDGCACAFEERVYGVRNVPESHELAHLWHRHSNSYTSTTSRHFSKNSIPGFRFWKHSPGLQLRYIIYSHDVANLFAFSVFPCYYCPCQLDLCFGHLLTLAAWYAAAFIWFFLLQSCLFFKIIFTESP